MWTFLDLSKHQMCVLAICFYFEMVGIIMGNFVARIPDIKEAHDLSDGVFGLLLLSGVGGGVISMLFVSTFVEYYGSRKGVLFGSFALAVITPIIGVPYNQFWILIIGIAGLGFGWGILEVCLNTQATLYEKNTGEHKMGFFQANYAFGGFLGSLISGGLAQSNVSPFINFISFCAAFVPFVLVLYASLYDYGEEKELFFASTQQYLTHKVTDTSSNDTIIAPSNQVENNAAIVTDDRASTHSVIHPLTGDINTKEIRNDIESNVSFGLNSDCKGNTSLTSSTSTEITDMNNENKKNGLSQFMSTLIPMGIMMFIAAVGEGSMNDWSTIFLSETLHFSPLLSALGFSLFAIMLCIVRWSSDHIRKLISLKVLICISGGVGSIGVFILISSAFTSSYPLRLFLAYLGLMIAGSGISIITPVLTTLVSNLPNCDPTQAIAFVTTFAYLGFMIGPPLFGGLSYLLHGLKWSLLIDGGLLMCIPLLGMFLPLLTITDHPIPTTTTTTNTITTTTIDVTPNAA